MSPVVRNLPLITRYDPEIRTLLKTLVTPVTENSAQGDHCRIYARQEL